MRLAWRSGIVAALVGGGGASAWAADPEGAVEESAEDSPLVDATVSMDWGNRYFQCGILHGAEGILLQPAAELGLNVAPDLGLRVFGGAWGSMHEAAPDADPADPASHWHEVDVYAGAEVALTDAVALSARYTGYLSPAMAFDHIHELAAKVAWDDSEAWGHALGHRFGGLQPALALAFDVERTDFTTGAGIGGDLTFEPTFALVTDGPVRLTLSVPLDIGLGVDGDGDGLGVPLIDYAHAGLTLALGLGFVPESAGTWSAKATGRVLALGGRLSADNGGERIVTLASLGVAAEF